jgi:hypothetical protein
MHQAQVRSILKKFLRGQIMAGAGDCKPTVLDTFGGDQRIRKFFDPGRVSAHDNDFQTIIVVEMHMERSNDAFAVIMLQISERLLQVAFVMIKDERNRARNLMVAVMLMMLDEMAADHIGKRLGAVVIAFLPRHHIEIAQKFLRQRGAYARSSGITFHITNALDRNNRAFCVKLQQRSWTEL